MYHSGLSAREAEISVLETILYSWSVDLALSRYALRHRHEAVLTLATARGKSSLRSGVNKRIVGV